jgi:hypothetical protein
MKILEKQDISKWKKVWTCTQCVSKLEASTEDIMHKKITEDSQRDSYMIDCFYLTCPVCERENSLVTKDISFLVRKYALDNTNIIFFKK